MRLAQVLLSISVVLVAFGPMGADFNKTHATNPLWTGHARFHVVWQAVSYAFIGILGLFLIWRNADREQLLIVWVILTSIIVSFFVTASAVKLYGGALYDKNGYLPVGTVRMFGRPVELDQNALAASVVLLVLIGDLVAVLNVG